MTRSTDDMPKLGFLVEDWQPPLVPCGARLTGRFATLEQLDAERHSLDLYNAYLGHDQVWDYLPYGPFDTLEAYRDWVTATVRDPSTCFYAIIDNTKNHAVGVGSYLRIDPASGSIEVGHLNFSPNLQKTKAATEAMFLMMQWAFEAGYRRYEWKCDAANLPSRRAAQRLGFSYEGVFRQATIVKARNRDTAWFACIDREWPKLRVAFEAWLADENFKDDQQKTSLAALTAKVRVAYDPTL